jgi:DNA repair protein RadA/Sms
MATGFDFSRMTILIAVLEKRAGLFFSTLDVYLNIVGGFRLDEPAGDLPVALSLYSSVVGIPIDEKLMAFGEVGLGGEVRGVSHMVQRLREAQRMGFETCIVPRQSMNGINAKDYSMNIVEVSNLKQAFAILKKSDSDKA